jgi:hypothetical protein
VHARSERYTHDTRWIPGLEIRSAGRIGVLPGTGRRYSVLLPIRLGASMHVAACNGRFGDPKISAI